MPAPDSRAAQLFRRCETVLLVTVLVAAAAAVQFAVGEARIPYELDYEEGNVLNAGLLIAQGATPYPDVQRLPVLNAYTPFFYVVVEHVIEHEGVQFAAPRLVCVLLGILAAVLVGALSWRFTNDVRRAVMFGCLYLTLPTVQYWLPLLRVDWLGLALALAGLCIVALRPRYWYAAALLFVAALFSKQAFAAAPAAVFAWLLWTRRAPPRRSHRQAMERSSERTSTSTLSNPIEWFPRPGWRALAPTACRSNSTQRPKRASWRT